MFQLLLPQRLDNNYTGHKIGLWLFALVVLIKAGIGIGSIFNGYQAASTADGIPLSAYPPAAAQVVVSLFALLGLLHLIICLMCLVALVRYRAMIPFMFTLLILEFLSRKLILVLMPITRSDAAPGTIVNLVLLAVMVIGLALSLRSQPLRPLASSG